MGRRTLLLIAAMLIAALGTSLIYLYVQGADQRALGTQAAQEVYVTGKSFFPGTTATVVFSSARSQRMAVSLSPGALTSATQVAGKVLTGPVPAGRLLTADLFSDIASAQAPTGLGKDEAAVSITLSDPARVAAYLTEGTKVAVYVTGSPTGGDAKGGASSTGETFTLIPSAKVLAVGPASAPVGQAAQGSSGGQASQPVAQSIVTLALKPDDVRRLIEAQTLGALYFAVLGSGLTDKGVPSTGSAKSTDVFKG